MPTSLNDRIQWCKIFDQSQELIRLTDKIAVRDFVQDRIGEAALPRLLGVYSDADQIDADSLPDQCVLKCNHDSGSATIINDRNHPKLGTIKNALKKRQFRTQSANGSDWVYWFIHPKILCEELFPPDDDNSLTDYKFYCSDGNVFFCWVVTGRYTNPTQMFVTPTGEARDICIYPKFSIRNTIRLPKNWNDMIEVASELSKGFRLVRVDLYSVESRTRFGEMSFWPMSGLYYGEGQKQAGAFIKMDLSWVNMPILEGLGTEARILPHALT